MTDRCVMTPPPELVRKWASEWMEIRKVNRDNFMAAKAAQWGADAELDACGEWMRTASFGLSVKACAYQLRAARRPKPPSLKEQALEALERSSTHADGDRDTIRRALEALPND